MGGGGWFGGGGGIGRGGDNTILNKKTNKNILKTHPFAFIF